VAIVAIIVPAATGVIGYMLAGFNEERRDRRTVPNKVMLSERPAEVADRAVPGHWEGDLSAGAWHRSAIGTLVECTSRYVLLPHLPEGRVAEAVNAAMADAIGRLPAELARSVTWDQGAPRCPSTSTSPSPLGSRSSSAIPTRRGRIHRKRTPTALYANSSPRLQTSVCTAVPIWLKPNECSTTARASPSNGASQVRDWQSCLC